MYVCTICMNVYVCRIDPNVGIHYIRVCLFVCMFVSVAKYSVYFYYFVCLCFTSKSECECVCIFKMCKNGIYLYVCKLGSLLVFFPLVELTICYLKQFFQRKLREKKRRIYPVLIREFANPNRH